VLFHAPRGIGSYAVVVGEAREAAEAVFDSRSLTDGDLFALALIEPTTYRVETSEGAGTGEIQVAPIPPGTDLRTVAPVYVDATSEGFEPAQLNVHAGQGIVFRARGAKRILITKRATPQPASTAVPAAAGGRRIRRHVRVWRPGAPLKGPRS